MCRTTQPYRPSLLVAALTLACVLPSVATPVASPIESGPPVVPEETQTPDTEVRFTVRVELDPGASVEGLAVGIRGSYDARPRSVGKTDAEGRVEFTVDAPGIVLVTVGDSAQKWVTYGSSATKSTVALFIDQPTELVLRHGPEGSVVASEGHELWPVVESNRRSAAYFDEVMTSSKGGQEAMSRTVDRQWAEIEAEGDERLRKLLRIHYATYVSQAVGPQQFLSILDSVPASDHAWVVQSSYLVELLFVFADPELQKKLAFDLREHHRDPGLLSALASWDLMAADKKGDEALVLSIYNELDQARFAPTIGWRNARKYDPDRRIAVGRALPPFTVQRTDDSGALFSEADLKGKAWVIQLWATWCPPCIEELDALPALYETLAKHRDKLGFISISIDDELELTKQTLSTRKVTWPSTWSADSEALMKAWDFSGVPLTLLIDAQGKVVEVWDEKASMRSIEGAVVKLLAGA